MSAAKLDLDHCTIVSPVDGRVGPLAVSPGSLITGGQTEPLATLSKMDPLTVEFYITEKEFPLMPCENGPIELESLCGSSLSVKGTVTFLDNRFNPEKGLLLVKGTIPNSSYFLRQDKV